MNKNKNEIMIRFTTEINILVNLVFCITSMLIVFMMNYSVISVAAAAFLWVLCHGILLKISPLECGFREWLRQCWYVPVLFLIILGRTFLTLVQFYFGLDTGHQYSQMGLLLTIMLFYGIGSMSVLIGRNKYSFTKLFIIQSILFGTVFCLIFPLNSIADEPQHMRTAYLLSDKMLGIANEKFSVWMRADDAEYDFSFPDYTLEDVNKYLDSFKQPLKNEELVLVEDNAEFSRSLEYTRRPHAFETELYQYLFPAIGITIGRVLKLNSVSMYLLGRFFNMFFYILIISLAIKIMPVGKSALYTIALLPMNLQLASSYSRDVFRVCAAVLTVALTLYLFYTEQEKVKHKKITIAALTITACLLLPLRNFVYSTIAVLPLLILLYRKQWITNRRILIAVIAVTVLGIILLAVKYILFPGVIVEEPEKYVAWMQEKRYTIQHFINYPLDLVWIFRNTFWTKTIMYIDTMIGSQLGWLNVAVHPMLVMVFGMLLIISAFNRSYEISLPPVFRAAAAVLSLLSILLITAGMIITWTPVIYSFAEGVQGRYFLPVLLPMLLAFRGTSVVVNEKCDRICIYLQFAALIYTVEFMLLRLL